MLAFHSVIGIFAYIVEGLDGEKSDKHDTGPWSCSGPLSGAHDFLSLDTRSAEKGDSSAYSTPYLTPTAFRYWCLVLSSLGSYQLVKFSSMISVYCTVISVVVTCHTWW